MLVKGQRQLLEGDTVRVSLDGASGSFVCFLLDANSKVLDGTHVAVAQANGFRQALSFGGNGVQIALGAIPAAVQRIAVAVTSSSPLATSGQGSVRVQSGAFTDSYGYGADFAQEKDAVFFEVYRNCLLYTSEAETVSADKVRHSIDI